jgi:hypothetical protein
MEGWDARGKAWGLGQWPVIRVRYSEQALQSINPSVLNAAILSIQLKGHIFPKVSHEPTSGYDSTKTIVDNLSLLLPP